MVRAVGMAADGAGGTILARPGHLATAEEPSWQDGGGTGPARIKSILVHAIPPQRKRNVGDFVRAHIHL
ncbi:hypothetical protein GCM10011504_58480 [Siccirubricoccus deserti]|nr:hypothetical protein GCM10011504_58480 [Siccirubricoccus deserti]